MAAALLLAAWSIGILAKPAVAAGDAETGRALAQQWCSSCHYVEGGAASDVAPAFGELAKRPVATEEGWRAWLTEPHPPMPDLQLSNQEIESIVAYLKSLR
ncbi:MAG: c-type cytochrome [Kiloniellales bacterium]